MIAIFYIMEPIQFFFIVIPLALIIAILVAVIFYLSKKTEESDYEKEVKELRKCLIKQKIDRKSYLYIRDNLKTEELHSKESERLNQMFENKKMDSETYMRMKKVLEMSFNERLVKIDKKYNLESSPLKV